jgi:hypothetical protein
MGRGAPRAPGMHLDMGRAHAVRPYFRLPPSAFRLSPFPFPFLELPLLQLRAQAVAALGQLKQVFA